ncbi:36804_t:CDS:2, partial [Gigaspora margarita]
MLPFRVLFSRTTKDVKLADIAQKQKAQQKQTSTNRPQRSYKIAVYFQETTLSIRHVLKSPHVCSYCDAKLLSGETKGFCCKKGKIKLASTESVVPLKDLYTRSNNVGKEFSNHGLDQRIYNAPTASQVAAIWIEGHDPVDFVKRDITVESKSQGLQYVSETSRCYNPMQYLLFFPLGDYGWHPKILQERSQKK